MPEFNFAASSQEAEEGSCVYLCFFLPSYSRSNEPEAAFEERLQLALSLLDQLYPSGKDLDADVLAAVAELAAWVHSEWVRIHPFANGNGRTARIWAAQFGLIVSASR